MSPATDPVLRPFRLKHLTLKNRVLSTAHAPGYAEDGKPKLRYQLYHEEKAKGGIALTMFGGSSNVAPDSASVFGAGQIYVGDDSVIPFFRELSERIHRHGAALMCQITHMGRRTVWNADHWLPTIAPSRAREPQHRSFPRAMDQEDIDRVVAAYAAAARRCREGGLDGAEVLSHGHLIDQFLSPLVNRRTDRYGGSLMNRARFGLEVFEAIRKEVGDRYIVGIRMGGDENREGGLSEDDCLEVARHYAGSGLVDFINVVFGRVATDLELAEHIVPGMDSPLAPFLERVRRFKEAVAIPVFHACRVSELATARYAIESGIVDMIGMTRAHLADPHLLAKLGAGREEEIRPCVGAAYCVDNLTLSAQAVCTHNPATGREATMPHVIAPSQGEPERIVVVGAGPAGLEAARVSALRGHRVVLLEAAAEAGGQLVLAAKASWRKDLIGIRDWLWAEVERLGVEARFNVLAQPEDVLSAAPTVVVIATGGVPDVDIVEGAEHVASIWDVLGGNVPLGDSVLVYDDCGRHSAASCVNFLRERGSDVELVTTDRMAGVEMGFTNFPIYLRRFYSEGVRITPDSRVRSVSVAGNRLEVEVDNHYGGPSQTRRVDQIVVDHGTVPVDDLFYALKPLSSNLGTTDPEKLVAGEPQDQVLNPGGKFRLFRVGDAASSRDVHAAIFDSLRLCKEF